MTDRLDDYLRRAAAKRFDWETLHCGFFAADWAFEMTGRDPMQPWRGQPADLAKTADVLKVAETQMAGFERIGAPVRGCIGIVEVPRFGPTSSIHCGPLWAVKTVEGIGFGRFRPLAMWAVA